MCVFAGRGGGFTNFDERFSEPDFRIPVYNNIAQVSDSGTYTCRARTGVQENTLQTSRDVQIRIEGAA